MNIRSILFFIALASSMPCFSYEKNQLFIGFESNEKFSSWYSKGQYHLNRFNTDRLIKKSGKNSFAIDVCMQKDSDKAYFQIPISIPFRNNDVLTFSADVLFNNYKGNIQLGVGVNIRAPDFKTSGVHIVDYITQSTTGWNTNGWIKVKSNISNGRDAVLKRIIKGKYGGIQSSQVNTTANKIGVMFYSKKGGGCAKLNIDNLTFIKAPKKTDLQAQNSITFKDYIKSHKEKTSKLLSSLNSNLISLKAVNDFQNKRIIQHGSILEKKLKNKLSYGKYLNGMEWDKLIATLEDTAYALKMHTLTKQKQLALFEGSKTNPEKIVSTTYPIKTPLLDKLNISISQGEKKSTSLILRAFKDFDSISISTSDLRSDNNDVITSDSIDIKLIKEWYQSNVSTSKTLLSELLVYDDHLLIIDKAKQTNKLRGINDKTFDLKYFDMESRQNNIPSNFIVSDAARLQPFAMPSYSNRQLWIAFKVTGNKPSGSYFGNLLIQADKSKFRIPITLTVLPIKLEKPILDYTIYYRGRLHNKPPVLTSENKTPKQYYEEMKDIIDHGFETATLHYDPDISLMYQALRIRNRAGMGCKDLFILNSSTGKPSTDVEIRILQKKILSWKRMADKNSCKNLYAYGIDEAKNHTLKKQRLGWKAVHQVGGKIYAACYRGAVDIVGDLLDIAILSGKHKPEETSKWHSMGKKVYLYGFPQAGQENPEIYRKNYGFLLWKNGYDGAMPYAYQGAYNNNIWNDFDNQFRKELTFTYPTTNSVISTLQWEGISEGINDVRYLSTLIKLIEESPNSRASNISRQWLNNFDSRLSSEDIRNKIIELILSFPDTNRALHD